MSAEAPLRPVYLLTGTDRPKVGRALVRLRLRFPPEAVETLSAQTSSGVDAVSACNALGLFADGSRLIVVEDAERWKKPDLDAVRTYLVDPISQTVLALVTGEAPKGSALTELCSHYGQVLLFDAPKPRDLPAWVRESFERLGVRAEADAAKALVEIVGDDVQTLASEVEKLADWSGGQSVGREDVEALAVSTHEHASWALTDAWGVRDCAALLRACEEALMEERPFVLAARMASYVGRVSRVQRLLEDGLAVREIAKRLKIHEFVARKAAGHAERYSSGELDEALIRLAALDAALKGASRLPPELELGRALLEITRSQPHAAMQSVG